VQSVFLIVELFNWRSWSTSIKYHWHPLGTIKHICD